MYRWVVAVTAFLVLGMSWGSTAAFGVFVTPVTTDMEWSRTGVSAAYSITVMVAFIVGIFWGWLSDRWSVRGVIAIAGAIMGLGWFLSSTSDTLWELYLFYGFIAGFGLGGTPSPLSTIVVRWFPRSPGMALGMIYSGFGGASALLPIVSEGLISLNGWRFGFQGVSYLVWGAFFVGIILLREPRSTAEVSSGPSGRGDGPARPATTGRPQRPPDDGSSIAFRVALVTLPFWTLFGMMFAGDLSLNMILVHLVPQAIDTGISSSVAATLLTVTGLVTMVSTMAGGVLGDRFGARRIFFVALLIVSVSLVWLTAWVWLTVSPALWVYYVFAVIFGMGTGAWFPQIAVLAARIFGTRHMGSIFGALLLAAGVGGVVGPILAGYVFDVLESYRIAFLIATGVTFAAVLLSVLLNDRPKPVPHRASRA